MQAASVDDARSNQEKGPLASLLTILTSKVRSFNAWLLLYTNHCQGTVDDGIINESLGLVRELLDSSDYDGITSAVRDPLDAELLIDFTLYVCLSLVNLCDTAISSL